MKHQNELEGLWVRLSTFLIRRYTLKKPPSKTKPSRVFLTLILPALLWWGGIHLRDYLIEPRCGSLPVLCSVDSVSQIDRFSLGIEDGKADGYSYYLQNTSAVLAFGIPIAWNTATLLLSTVNPVAFWTHLTSDLLLMAQTIAWNGLFTEVSHLISQRPRPFVYQDPATRGAEASHYTSFYSGHTSFVATTQTAILLFFLVRGAPVWLLMLSLGCGQAMTFATAYFRIFAGRHFLTDVLCGAFAGVCVALLIFLISGRASSLKNE